MSQKKRKILFSHMNVPAKDRDPVIISGYRSPFCKAKKGSLCVLEEEGMLAQVLKGTIKRSGISAKEIEAVIVGNSLCDGTISLRSRMAALRAGVRVSVPVMAVNRQCASGLDAIALLCEKIRSGEIQCGAACGVESMTKWFPQTISSTDEWTSQCESSNECLIPMGITSENVSRDFGVGRDSQDEFAVSSQRKAFSAREKGVFAREIVPVVLPSGEIIDTDEGIRESTLEGLRKLKGAFGPESRSTAGNSSQVSDGAGAVIITSRKFAVDNLLEIRAEFLDYVVEGVPPRIMGVGPAVAVPKLLQRNNVGIDDVDVFEINEAFASQCLYCAKSLGIPSDKLNVHGGAISLGHPLGATGIRLVISAISVMDEVSEGKKELLSVVSLCVGGGYGAAALLRKVKG